MQMSMSTAGDSVAVIRANSYEFLSTVDVVEKIPPVWILISLDNSKKLCFLVST